MLLYDPYCVVLSCNTRLAPKNPTVFAESVPATSLNLPHSTGALLTGCYHHPSLCCSPASSFMHLIGCYRLLPTHGLAAFCSLQDESTRYRAVLRAQNLFTKGHSVSHNIITGESRANPVFIPSAPLAPWEHPQ